MTDDIPDCGRLRRSPWDPLRQGVDPSRRPGRDGFPPRSVRWSFHRIAALSTESV